MTETDFKLGDEVIVDGAGWHKVKGTVHGTDGDVWKYEVRTAEGKTGLFHAHELKLVEPEPKFQVGNWVEITNWGSTDGTKLQVSETPTAESPYYRFVDKPDYYGFSERYLKAAESPKGGFVKNEAVKHPAHYGGGDNPYEAIKVIEAWGLGFNLGNAAKYLARAGKKGNKVEDLNKLIQYVQFEIAKEEAK